MLPRLRAMLCMFYFVAFASVALLFTPAGQCQILNVGDDTSTPIEGAGHDYIKMLSETVNPGNGSVSVRIQAPVAKGRGITLPFAFAYDTNGVVHLSAGVGAVGWTSNGSTLAQGGWSYSLPTISSSLWSTTTTGSQLQTITCYFVSYYVFQDPSGGRHNVGMGSAGWAQGAAPPYLCGNTVTTGGDPQYSASLLTAYGDGDTNPAVTVSDADGTLFHFSDSGANNGTLPTSIEDRNGNEITATSGGLVTYKDTVGRAAIVISGFGPNGATNTLTISGSTYKAAWTTTSAAYSVPNVEPIAPPAGTQCLSWPSVSATETVISSITLPNNQQYHFYYGTNPNSAYNNPYGLLSEIDYPNGAWVRYTWKMNTTSEPAIYYSAGLCYGGNCNSPMPNGCQYEYGTPVVATRTVGFTPNVTALTQTFSYSTTWTTSGGFVNWTAKTTNVTTTDNLLGKSALTKYTYSPGGGANSSPYQGPGISATEIPLEQKVQYYDWGNTLIRTVTKTWADVYDIASEQTVLNDGNNLTSQTTYSYQFAGGGGTGILSQLFQKNEYDYGLSLLRKTVTTYQAFPATPVGGIIADKPCQNIVYDASSNRVAETDYFYDGGATLCGTAGTPSVTAASGLVAGTHDETNYGSTSTAPRANMTQQTRWSSAGTSPVTTYTYDETGQVLGITDPCGSSACADMVGTTHKTTYSYSDSYTILSGGQNVNYTPTGNTNAYLTKVTDPLGHATTFTYDYSNGQLTVSKDQNDITANRPGTTYVYNDPFARPRRVTYPDGGQTTFSYNDTAPSPTVTTTKLIDSTSNISATSIAVMDGVGHIVQTQLTSDPDGPDYVDVTYDGFGRVKTRSNSHRGSGATTDGTTSYTYDALGRTIRVDQPDGSVVSTSYSGNQTVTTDEVANDRRMYTDGLGRLTRVDEPIPTALPTPASASITIADTGIKTSTDPATPGTGSFSVNGTEKQVYFCPAACFWIWDQGSVSVSVNGGGPSSVSFGQGSTSVQLSQSLANSVNTSSLVSAVSDSNGNVTVTARTGGANTNYPLAGSSQSSLHPPPSGSPGFSVYAFGLTGGTDASPIYDSGTVSATVNGCTAGATYSRTGNNSASTVASALAAALNSSCSGEVSASASGNVVTLTTLANGSATNSDTLSAISTSNNPTVFNPPSFTPSSTGFSGGTDDSLSAPLITQYAYDALNNLTCAVQKGTDTTAFTSCASAAATWRPRSFGYDSLSRLTSAQNPESGTITYVYDANGNLQTKTAPAPNHSGGTVQTTNTYDSLNRLTKRSYSNGNTPTVQYGYDGGALTNCTTAPPTLTDGNPVGTRTAMCDGSGATSWSHDAMGRPATLMRTIGGFTRSASYQYNVDGSLALETIFSGRQLQYGYNGAGRVISVVDPGAFNFVTGATYTSNGALATAIYGAAGSFAGITESNIYNNRLQPILRSATSSAGTAISLCYDFHLGVALTSPCSFPAGAGDNGNVFQIFNNRDTTRTQNFTYDALNRITSGYTTSSLWGTSYVIDAWGNLTNINPMTGKTNSQNLQAAPANTKNQLNGFCHDVAGNLAFNSPCPTPPWSFTTYVYDAENRLITAAGATYIYDGDGNRVEKLIGNTGTIYWRESDGELTNETDTTNVTLHRHVYFAGREVCRTDTQPTTTTHYYFSDHLGSANVVASGTDGSIEDDSDFYPYGGELVFKNNVPQNYKFTGKERDSESGLDMFGARYYVSTVGRFMSIDPAFESEILELPQTWNRYSYVYNRPLFATDPDGRCPPCVGAIIGGVVEGGWNLGSQLVNNGGNVSGVNWREVGANALGGAVAGALAGATGGGSLLAEAAMGAGSNVAGGIVTRVAEGRDPDEAFDTGEIVSDAVSGFVGGGAGHLASDFVHPPEGELGARPKGRRHAAKYDAEVKLRKNAALRALGVSTVAGSPPAHAAQSWWNSINQWSHQLFVSQAEQQPPRGHVTTRMCWTDQNGKMVCQ